MDRKYTYAFRGIIAFFAFTNLGVAVKAFVENKCLLIENSASVDSALPRVFGILAILQSLILIHCALYIHQKSIISLGILSSVLNIVLFLTETLIYHTIPFDFQIVFPCCLNVAMIIGFAASLLEFKMKEEECDDDENSAILKFANTLKRNRMMKKFK